MNTNSNPTPTQNNAYSQVPSPAKPVNSQPGDSLTQTQRAALHALIEARLDGLRGKERNRRRNELLHELPEALGVDDIKGITPALYPSAVAWLSGQAEPDAQAQTKERLLSLLDQISDKLIPEPAPLPDKINPAKIYTSAILQNEKKAVCGDIERLGHTLNEYHHAVKIAAKGLLAGSNSTAWSLIFNQLEHQAHEQFQDARDMLASIHHQTQLTAMLVTIARAGALPEDLEDGEEMATRV